MSDKKLILLPSALAQWQALLQEAQNSRTFYLSEDLESYMAYLLMRFANANTLGDSVVGQEFLESLQAIGSLRHEKLRDVGDKCLLFSGSFPGNADRRCVNIQYFVDLGQTAYGTVAQNAEYGLAALFDLLCQEFENLILILRAMRELHQDSNLEKILDVRFFDLQDAIKKLH